MTLTAVGVQGVPTKEELKKGFTIAEWEVLPARGELRRGDEVERPEFMVMAVLLALAERGGNVVSKDELVDEVWSGRATSDDAIIQKIAQLRSHFEDKDRPYRYVETLTRVGYRLLPEVVLKEPASPQMSTPASSKRPWILGAVALVAILAVVSIVGPRIIGSKPRIGSIGVLPCDNLSGNASDQYLVNGFHEELIKTLHNIPIMSVMPGRIPYPDLEVPEIASRLGVESVLFCAVQHHGGMLKINYRVDRGSDGLNILSDSITGPVEEIFVLQERVAVAVRDKIRPKSKQQLISSSRPRGFEAYDRFLLGRYEFERRGQPGNLEEAIDLFEETIELDPQFGPAYLSLAMAHALLHDARNAPLEEWHDRAISIVEQGIAVDESIRDPASAIFGFVYQQQRNWTLAEQAYMRATSAQVIDSTAFNWYAQTLASVGRLDDALDMSLAAHRIDPTSAVINTRVAIAYTWLNDNDNASKFYARAEQLGGRGITNLQSHALVLRRLGDLEAAIVMMVQAIDMLGDDSAWIEPVSAALRDPAQRESGLAAIDRSAANERINLRIEVTLRTLLGDVDGALRVAKALSLPGETLEVDFLFLPELLPLRQHPEFLELMDSLGITDYWDEAGCIWQGTAVQCPQAF